MNITDELDEDLLLALEEEWPIAEAHFEVDLLEANPDIRKLVSFGGSVVGVYEFLLKRDDAPVYGAIWSDGMDYSFEELVEMNGAAFFDSVEEAREQADQYIIQWKRNWDLPIH